MRPSGSSSTRRGAESRSSSASPTRSATARSIIALSKAGVDGGADGVYIYDSRGQSTPRSSFVICREIKKAIGDKLLYVQHHNDLGMATACSLAAAEAGADVLDASMCGVGDRSGTAALEEVAAVPCTPTGSRRGSSSTSSFRSHATSSGRSDSSVRRRSRSSAGRPTWRRDGAIAIPDDPVESPMAIAGEVLGTPFESVIGPNVFGKIKITQAPACTSTRTSSPTSWMSSGSTTARRPRRDRATYARRLVARREGYIRIDEFEQIVRGVLDNLPAASG